MEWWSMITRGKQMKEKRERGRKRRMMQTQLLASPWLLHCDSFSFSVYVSLSLSLSSFFVFLFLFVSLVIRSSSFSDAEKARS